MLRIFMTGLGTALALSACTPVEIAGVMRLGPSPTLDGGRYSTGGGITVAVEAMPIDGMTALCGVWAESERQSTKTIGKAHRVLDKGSVFLGGTVLHRDLGYLRNVPPSDSYGGLEAHCVKTDRPWQPGTESAPLTVRIPDQVVEVENNDFGALVFKVTFKQSGPGA